MRRWANTVLTLIILSLPIRSGRTSGGQHKYLQTKFYARRNNVPLYEKVHQAVRGIYGIAKSLGWSDEQRRRFYLEQTGKDHLEKMTRQEKIKVYKALQLLQKQVDERGVA